jgi:hypothetical protein
MRRPRNSVLALQYPTGHPWVSRESVLGINMELNIPCISVKLPALVHAKYQDNFAASAVSLVKNGLVMLLSCPQSVFNTQV